MVDHDMDSDKYEAYAELFAPRLTDEEAQRSKRKLNLKLNLISKWVADRMLQRGSCRRCKGQAQRHQWLDRQLRKAGFKSLLSNKRIPGHEFQQIARAHHAYLAIEGTPAWKDFNASMMELQKGQ